MKRRIAGSLGLMLALAAIVRADGGGDSGTYTFVNGDDRAELERGEWRVVAMTTRGKEYPKERLEAQERRMVFKGNSLSFKTGAVAKTFAANYTFIIRPNSRPKEIEWAGNNKVMSLGIYQLENDTLKIAFGRSERPKDFSPDANSTTYVLKRVKP